MKNLNFNAHAARSFLPLLAISVLSSCDVKPQKNARPHPAMLVTENPEQPFNERDLWIKSERSWKESSWIKDEGHYPSMSLQRLNEIPSSWTNLNFYERNINTADTWSSKSIFILLQQCNPQAVCEPTQKFDLDDCEASIPLFKNLSSVKFTHFVPGTKFPKAISPEFMPDGGVFRLWSYFQLSSDGNTSEAGPNSMFQVTLMGSEPFFDLIQALDSSLFECASQLKTE